MHQKLANGATVTIIPNDIQEADNVIWVHVFTKVNDSRVEGWIIQTVLQTATPIASPPTWNNTIKVMFQTRCSTCHGAVAAGGLSLSTYADAMKGGISGLVIIPGDSNNSSIVQHLHTAQHPGQLPLEEMEQLIEWINAGAPET